ncbi:TIGR01777 family oxidoreductase [Arthrobacter sp. MYb227]|uniref:TIGR01777 family oxidoreductase n=1 Tax=Arthrobacter sp. MYb227 TaxID=1848601 RepID=UPI0015E28F7A|nr:TIGR01777 family oxidoreductase [Arthrobacter sp. MYb227]
MATFEYTTRLSFDRETVFQWFERPGALPRLSAPFLGSIVQEPTNALNVGSRAVLEVSMSGTLGLGLDTAIAAGANALGLPSTTRARIPWKAKHISLDRGRSFTDIMESGPIRRWEHQHFFSDIICDGQPGTLMRDVVEFELPGLGMLPWQKANKLAEDAFARELLQVFKYRENTLRADLGFHAKYPAKPLTIAVAGASGIIGSQLCALLAGGGHQIIRLVRDRNFAREPDRMYWNPESGELDATSLAKADAVINLAGHTIGGRFSEENKRKIQESRIRSTRLLADTLASLATDGKKRSFISASAIGIYGAKPHHGNPSTALDELAPVGNDFLATVCRDWEAACDPAREAGVRVVTVRTGLVQTPETGALAQLLPLFSLGLGGPLGHGGWQSWVGIDDMAGIYAHALLTPELAGPINAVAPNPVQAWEYAQTLGKVLRRPAKISVPAFGPQLILGTEGAEELAFASQKVSNAKLIASGYESRHSNLESALRHNLGKF